MADRYAQIRDALAMGPTPGPWDLDMPKRGGWSYISGKGWWDFARVVKVDGRANVEGEANARLIAACDPDTIRELLAERDQLAAALAAAQRKLPCGHPAVLDDSYGKCVLCKYRNGYEEYERALTAAQREIADLRNRLNLSEKMQGRFPQDAIQPKEPS